MMTVNYAGGSGGVDVEQEEKKMELPTRWAIRPLPTNEERTRRSLRCHGDADEAVRRTRKAMEDCRWRAACLLASLCTVANPPPFLNFAN